MQEERRSTERRSEWRFEITDQGWLWAVTRPTGTEEKASAAYQTLKDAADDALGHGYGMWRSQERRAGERRDTEH